MKQINSQVMKHLNALTIVQMIQRHAPISRTELAAKVGLTLASVANITNVLVEDKLLEEVGLAEQNGYGRKAVLLDLCADAYFSIGVSLNTQYCTVGICNFRGELLFHSNKKIDVLSPPFELLEILGNQINDAIIQSGIERDLILGVGLAIPGPIDFEKGIIINPPNFPYLRNIPISQILEEKLNIPVCCDVETNAAMLAEYLYGEAGKYKTAVFLSLFKTGVGGGIISNGNIFHGFRDSAGEFGHITIDPLGQQCSCGNYGCLETLVSQQSLVRQAKQLYRQKISQDKDIEYITVEEIFKRGQKGDLVCVEVIERTAYNISLGLGNIINLFSPQMIVIGGDYAEECPMLIDLIKEHIAKKPYPLHCKDIIVEKTSFGDLVYAKGGMVLAQTKFLPDKLKGE